MVLLAQVVNFHLYRGLLSQLRSGATTEGIDVKHLKSVVGRERIAVPMGEPAPVVRALTENRQLSPSYFSAGIGMWDREAEERAIARMREARFVLLPPLKDFVYSEPLDNSPVKRTMRLGFVYTPRRVPYFQGALIKQELEARWQVVEVLGWYTLYRRVR